MPEGDTVHKLARALRPQLEGLVLERLWLRDRGTVDALGGWRVAEVAALGKHLLIALARDVEAVVAKPDWVVHVHLGMHGRWERRAAGVAPDPRHWPGAMLLCVAETELVCTRPAVAELVRRRELASHPQLSRLGPDLLAPPVPFAHVVARARRREPCSAAELLLDQRVACGAGNVIANETLFWERVDPRASTADLGDETLEALFRRAAGLLEWNAWPGSGPRTTTRHVAAGRPLGLGEPRHFVHERAGLPCLRCSVRIEVARLGDAARPAYWCPRCQVLTERG